MLSGPLGALFGAALGHRYDQARRSGPGATATETIQAAFFTAVFSVMGHIAKADGRVSREEISMVQEIMRQMQLDERQKAAAINLFQQGKEPDFPLEAVLGQLRAECRYSSSLLRIFLEIQIQAAAADGRIDPAERRILERIVQLLGFSPSVLEELLQLDPHAPHEALADDYQVLGISENASEAQIKKAYRRLMNQHHPDKLIAKGMPEEMIRVATDRTQKIRSAYDRIRESRKQSSLH